MLIPSGHNSLEDKFCGLILGLSSWPPPHATSCHSNLGFLASTVYSETLSLTKTLTHKQRHGTAKPLGYLHVPSYEYRQPFISRGGRISLAHKTSPMVLSSLHYIFHLDQCIFYATPVGHRPQIWPNLDFWGLLCTKALDQKIWEIWCAIMDIIMVCISIAHFVLMGASCCHKCDWI